MIEVMIERWVNPDSATDYRWSVWRDGQRLAMGNQPYSNQDDCETAGRAFCLQELGQEPDKVIRL